MTEHKTKARLYVAGDLEKDGAVSLAADQTHYLSRVMRLGVGDGVTLFNGRHGEWRAVIESVARNSCTLTLGQKVRAQSTEPDLWLTFAPLKKSRTDFLVEKATELGVARLTAVFTEHSDTRRVNTARLGQIATEAAEQCERLSVPEISGPLRLADLIADWPDERTLLVADETGGGQPLARVLAPGPGQKLGLLIGPEGGFSSSELDLLKKLPFSVFIGLGPRILRAETAALAALACVQSLIGEWNTTPRSG